MDTRQVVGAVRRMIPLSDVELPDEFYPAHLSIALIDAVFRPGLDSGTVTLLERYCRRFGIALLRKRRWETPPRDRQEPLGALVHHYESSGLESMTHDVYRVSAHAGEAASADAQRILAAARALQGIDVEVLQDLHGHVPDEIEYALRTRAGLREPTVRRFLMYTAGEEFARGDLPVRRFMAHALGVEVVSSTRAEGLVRSAAHELILSPRFLDFRIWTFGASERGSAILLGRG